MNGDHVAALEYDPRKIKRLLKLPALRPVPQGQADHHDDLRLLGRQALAPLRRHALHAPGDLPLEPHQLPLRRRALAGGRAVVVGAAEEALDLRLVEPDRAAGDGRGHHGRPLRPRAPAGRRRAAERRAGRDRHVQLPALRAVDPRARAGGQGDGAGGRAARPGEVHEAHRDPGRLRGAPARRVPDGGLRGPRRGERPLRGLRQRGPVLHGLLGDPDLAGREPVAHDRRGVRARRGAPHQARAGSRAAGAAGRVQAPHARGDRGRARGAQASAAPRSAEEKSRRRRKARR